MEPPGSAEAQGARASIAPLQRRVMGWMDADRVLPADGSFLLAALERALQGLTGESPSTSRDGIVAFIRRVDMLIDTGVLDAVEGRLTLEAARAILAATSCGLAVSASPASASTFSCSPASRARRTSSCREPTSA